MRPVGWLLAATILAGCSLPLASGNLNVPSTQSWTGSAQSAWFQLPADGYQVESRMAPAGCATRIVMAGQNEYPVVELWPQFLPHETNPAPPPSSQWTGVSSHLVAGSYRIEGTAPSGCQWSVRISHDRSGDPAPRATCNQLATFPGSFVRITGTRVVLPPDSALARSTQLVQPDNVPISHFGIGIDDGTGTCPVLWLPNSDLPPVPSMGERVTFTAQVVGDGDSRYLGITLHP